MNRPMEGLSHEAKLLAIMDAAGEMLLEHLAAGAPPVDRVAELEAEVGRLRTALDHERAARRRAEDSAEVNAKVLREERRRAWQVQANLDAVMARVGDGPCQCEVERREVARLMQPGGR
jgi:hypothetical protein